MVDFITKELWKTESVNAVIIFTDSPFRRFTVSSFASPAL